MKNDVIIIGSGIGSLACAAALSVMGKKVLVIEKHTVAGGYLHSFSRGPYRWNIGTHNMGAIDPDEALGRVFNFLTGNSIRLKKMDHDFDELRFPGFSFSWSAGLLNTALKLSEQFPDEKERILEFFELLQNISLNKLKFIIPRFFRIGFADLLYRLLTIKYRKVKNKTVYEVVNDFFNDERLKKILMYHVSKIGLSPEKFSFITYALIVGSYGEGAFYPASSGDAIISALITTIKNNNGVIRTACPVNEILVKGRKACGVILDNDLELYADIIVSGIGIKETLKTLLDPAVVPNGYGNRINHYNPGLSGIVLYVGLKGDITSFNIANVNYRIFTDNFYNFDASPAKAHWHPNTACIFLHSNRDPDHTDPDHHTLQIIAPCPYKFFKTWENTEPGERGEDYDIMKSKVTKKLLAILNNEFPGIDKLVDYTELGTPLTFHRYTGNLEGAHYGLGSTPEKFNDMHLLPKTPIKNLYLTGRDVFLHGIIGAFTAGVITASAVTGKILFSKLGK